MGKSYFVHRFQVYKVLSYSVKHFQLGLGALCIQCPKIEMGKRKVNFCQILRRTCINKSKDAPKQNNLGHILDNMGEE